MFSRREGDTGLTLWKWLEGKGWASGGVGWGSGRKESLSECLTLKLFTKLSPSFTIIAFPTNLLLFSYLSILFY